MSDFETPPSSADSAVKSDRAPRLGILHLMLWTAASGVYLALLRSAYESQDNFNQPLSSFRWALYLVVGLLSITNGATLTASIVLLQARLRHGPPLLAQPGHWLAVIDTLSNLLYLLVANLFMLLSGQTSGSIEDVAPLFVLLFIPLSLLPAVGYAFVFRETKERRWSVWFGAMIVINLLCCARFGLSPLNFVMAVWLVVVALLDIRAGLARDWLHWTGVTAFAASSAVIGLWSTLIYFVV